MYLDLRSLATRILLRKQKYILKDFKYFQNLPLQNGNTTNFQKSQIRQIPTDFLFVCFFTRRGYMTSTFQGGGLVQCYDGWWEAGGLKNDNMYHVHKFRNYSISHFSLFKIYLGSIRINKGMFGLKCVRHIEGSYRFCDVV